MCAMNFWCSITIIFIILIAALVLTNSIDVHVSRKHHGKSQQLLNDFRAGAYKAKKDIEVLESFVEFNEERGKRRRRQTDDFFDNFGDETMKETFEEEQLQPNCKPDICKARNCAGGICRAESSKHSLKSSKELNNFLNNLKRESKNMPKEIHVDEREPDENEVHGIQKAEEVDGKDLKEKTNCAAEKEVKDIYDREKRLKPKGANKNDLRFSWSQNGEKARFQGASNIKQHLNFAKDNQLDTDLSSCQQCSQNKDKDVSKTNCKTHKNLKPVVGGYENIQFSKEPETAEVNRNFFNNFERKYHKKVPTHAAEDDDDDEEDDELYHSENLKLSPHGKNEINQYEFKQPALKISQSQENSLPLNDQVEVTKNNLSHEADYKLSKDEQNASENKKYAAWKWGIFKRSHPFNAMNEIKLKTSQRLMKKGLGASLPSYSLAENRRDLFIDNKLRQREKQIFQSDNRKHKHFDDTNNIENSFGETINQLNDLAELPLESDLSPLPRNDWSNKRISDINTRYKRELNLWNNQSLRKVFKPKRQTLSFKQNNFENNIKAKPVKAEVDKKLMNMKKAFNAKSFAKQIFLETHTNNINATNFKEPKNGDIYKDYKRYSQDLKTQNLTKLNFSQNAAKDLQANKYLPYKKHSLYNVISPIFAQTLKVLQNSTKAFKADHNFNHEKSINRVKRSLVFLPLKPEVMHNKQSKFFLDKPENAERSFDLNYYTLKPSLLQTFKHSKRSKRFNADQTIDLKIYQKFHSAKALEQKKHQRVSNQTYSRLSKSRHKRAASFKKYARNSAVSLNTIKKGAKMLMNKAVQFQKNIENFFKKSLKYLTFQERSFEIDNNFKASSTESAVVNSSEVLQSKKNKLKSANETKQKEIVRMKDKSSNIKISKYYHETKNPKLRLFKNISSQFVNSKQYLKSFKEHIAELAKRRTKRSAVQVVLKKREKTPQNSNCLRSLKKSFKDPPNETRFSRDVFGKANSSASALQIQEGNTSATRIPFFNLNKKFKVIEQSRSQELSNMSHIKSEVNVENKFKEEFKQSLSFDESFVKENFTQQILENNNNSNRRNKKLKHKIDSNQSKRLQSSTEINVDSSYQQSSMNFRFKNKAQNAISLKRLKRTLTSTSQEDLQHTDATNHMTKRDYFFRYGDFYRPNNKPDTAIKMPSKVDINIDNSQKISTNEMLPAPQEINFDNYYKTLNMEKFDDLKNYNPQSSKFDNLQFDNLWPETKPQYENLKQQKRFLDSPDNKSSKISGKKRNDAAKNHKYETKPPKLPEKVQILKDKYLKDLQNFNKNYKFNANNYNWSKSHSNGKTNFNNTSNTMDYSEKLGLELHNEILNCKAFGSLEDFINSLPKNLTQPLLSGNFTTEKIEIDINTLITTPEVTTTTRPLILESTEKCSVKNEGGDLNTEITESSAQATQPPSDIDLEQTSEFEPPNEEEENEETSLEPAEEEVSTENVTPTAIDRDNVKLNISINAHVQGNPKEQRYCGNGTFSVTPGLLDDRLRRDLNFSPLEKTPEQFLHMTTQETTKEEDYTDFISGKFSSRAVKDILSAVQQNPELRALWPNLNPSQQFDTPNTQNFYAIRNQQNEPQLRNSERLFAQAMSAINAIVEQQARSHLCVPLRPDLQEFYNMIVQSRQQQDLVRAKRQNTKSSKKQDFGYQLHLVDPNKIEEKTKIVKKLLKQYEELPKEDQQQVAAVRDDLLKNLIVLRQLQDNEERQGSELREKRENDWAASDEEVLKDLQSQYSLPFLKLLKAAELYREIKNN